MTRRIDLPVDELQLAIPRAVIERLIGQGALCAAEVRCLDLASKQHLQRVCLCHCAGCAVPRPVWLAKTKLRR